MFNWFLLLSNFEISLRFNYIPGTLLISSVTSLIGFGKPLFSWLFGEVPVSKLLNNVVLFLNLAEIHLRSLE